MPSKERNIDWEPFGAALRELLAQQQMTQRTLAKALGWQESKVSEIISGRTIPKDQDVASLEGAIPQADGRLRKAFERCRTGDHTPAEELRRVSEALRPFRILAEVRLSTLYRTATMLLAGAALMLLIPLLFPDAPARLLGAVGRVADLSLPSALLLGLGMGVTFAVPVWGFIMVIADLAGFFFTGHRFDVVSDDEKTTTVFNPRLALPGMLAPSGEMPGWAYDRLREKRLDQLGILLPIDDEWRTAFDDRMRRIFHLASPDELSDESRMGYAFRLSVSVPRTLLDEAAKIELSLAKHNLLLRICLMRFIKTLLLVPVTVLVVVTATALLESGAEVFDRPDDPILVFIEMLAVFLLWGPLAVGAVGSPNRWIQRMSPGVGDIRNVYDDPRMVRFENGVVFMAVVSALMLTTAGIIFAIGQGPGAASWLVVALTVGTALLWAYTKMSWWKGYLGRTPRAFVEMLRVGAH